MGLMTGKICLLEVGLLMLILSGAGHAGENDPAPQPAGAAVEEAPRGRIELKRDMTNRGTPEESTRTWLKIDAFKKGTIALLRLEIPFPDEKTDFDGSPFDPRLGDIKIRVGFQPVPVNSVLLSSFIEALFPTANPEQFGSGKYELSAGLETSVPVPLSRTLSESHSLYFNPLIQQVVSVAGDENRKDINYTKFELALKDTWRQKYWIELTAKPVVDWEQNAKTGAVAELEGGWTINRDWAAWLMCGTRLWGEGVPLIYGSRVQIGAARLF
jgi:hypothetical protein